MSCFVCLCVCVCVRVRSLAKSFHIMPQNYVINNDGQAQLKLQAILQVFYF